MLLLLMPFLQAFVYLAGLQLLLVSGRQSLLTLAASTLAGLLYRLNFCNIKKLRVGAYGKLGMRRAVAV